MLNGQLNNYTNEQLSKYTNRQLALLNYLGYIFDRTEEDVKRWRELRDKGWDNMTEAERQEWFGEIISIPSASKGMYTHNDLNRVESGVEGIAACLQDMGYTVPEMVFKTDWTYRDTITKEDVTRYLGNVETIRGILTVPITTPRTPKINENFDYSKANDVEQILESVIDSMASISESWYYAGELKLGEV